MRLKFTTRFWQYFSYFLVIPVILSCVFLIGVEESLGQKYPARPITIIVTWVPGSTSDLIPRAMAPKFSSKWGIPVNVVNKPGGSGIIGTLEALNSTPDGYTILTEAPGISSVPYAWVDNLPFDIEKRTYLARAVFTPFSVVVRASAPWKTMADIEKEIRTNPSTFRWTLSGGSAASDVPVAQFKTALAAKGVDLSKTKTVNFKGTGEIMISMGGDHVDIAICSPGSAAAMISAGKVKPIAVCADKRYKGWPDIPTTAEQGFPTVKSTYWIGYSAPPGLPETIQKTWIEAVRDLLRDPELLDKFDKMGVVPSLLTGEEFKKWVISEGKAIKALNIR